MRHTRGLPYEDALLRSPPWHLPRSEPGKQADRRVLRAGTMLPTHILEELDRLADLVFVVFHAWYVSLQL